MTQKMHDLYASVIEKTEQAKKLEAEIKAAKAEIIRYHGDRKMICEDGFQSVIKHTVRDTPQLARINELHGLNLSFETDPECFKRTEYDSLSVSRMING